MGTTFLARQHSWLAAFGIAVAIEALILALFAIPSPLSRGPDNPIPLLLAAVLQSPGSWLSVLLAWAATSVMADENTVGFIAVAFVPVVQVAFFTVLLRKPWRASEHAPNRSYEWSCQVCGTANAPASISFHACGAPAVISAREIDGRQRARGRGEIFVVGKPGA